MIYGFSLVKTSLQINIVQILNRTSILRFNNMSYLSARYIKEVFGSGFTWVVEEIIGNLDNIIREPCLCNAGKSVSALLSFLYLLMIPIQFLSRQLRGSQAFPIKTVILWLLPKSNSGLRMHTSIIWNYINDVFSFL